MRDIIQPAACNISLIRQISVDFMRLAITFLKLVIGSDQWEDLEFE